MISLLLFLAAPLRAQPVPPALAELMGAAGSGAAFDRSAPAGVPRAAAAFDEPARGELVLDLVDGARRPFRRPVLLRVIDGRHRERLARFVNGPRVRITELPLEDNFADDYTVIASADGWGQAGVFPLHPRAGKPAAGSLMLLPERGRFDLSEAGWDALTPPLRGLLAAGAPGPDAARERYARLVAERPEVAAAVHNIGAAAALLEVGGRPALSYYQELSWDELSSDNSYGWVDARLVALLRADRRRFAPEGTHGVFHPGSTSSFKQTEYEEGNVQFTFYENERRVVGGVDCVRLETDIDLYRDPLSHLFLEVLPVLGRRGTTDPRAVYALRWMAGRRAGAPDFEPPYRFVAE